MRTKAILFLILSSSVLTIFAQSRRSVWNSSGVYTSAQAAKGKLDYDRLCIRCHAGNLEGVADANLLGDFAPRYSLRGTEFMERWREDTAYNLFNLIRKGMPPRNEPGKTEFETLSDEAYVNIVALIFQGNGFPAGDRELTVQDLRSVRILEKEGSKPLPSFSVVEVVGCLTQYTPGVWQLSSATEPTRIREFATPTEEEIKLSAAEPLGNFEYDLQSIGYLGRDFDPKNYEGQKMQARGILIRQPPNIRIDLRSLVAVADTCER